MNAQTEPTELSCTLRVDASLQQHIARGVSSLDIANAIIVDSADMAQLASNERTELARAIDKMKELRKGFLAPAQQIIDNAKALFDPALNALEESRTIIGNKLKHWTEAEEARVAAERRAAEEVARRARQEAEAAAAAERARAAEKAAAERRAAEEAEERRRKAAAEGNARAAAAAAAEAARAAERAQAAEENAATKVDAIQTAAAAVIPMPAPAPAKIAGTSLRDNWIARLQKNTTEDQAKALIVAACATRPELMALLKLDTSAINKMAKALKGAMNVPGFEAYNDKQIAGSRK